MHRAASAARTLTTARTRVTYAHQWDRPARLDDDRWARISNDIALALQLFRATSREPAWREVGVEPVMLCGPDGAGEPVVGPTRIAFNGDASRHGAGEPFLFPQDATGPTGAGRVHASCDTALLPYDICVCTALLIAKFHLEDALVLRSDGSVDELGWPVAREVAGTVLGIRGGLRESGEKGIVWEGVGDGVNQG